MLLVLSKSGNVPDRLSLDMKIGSEKLLLSPAVFLQEINKSEAFPATWGQAALAPELSIQYSHITHTV